MRVSTLFWGILLVLIGGLFLLNNLGVLDVNWDTIWRLWPMILVFWGLSILVGKQRTPWYVVLSHGSPHNVHDRSRSYVQFIPPRF